MNPQLATPHPWYRELWPWLLMAGPAAVIVAGVFTAYLAVVSNDGLVADDYYKRGLAINQTLARDAAAQKLDYRARIELAADYDRVKVSFASSAPAGDLLVLRLAHAGRPALDRLLPLTAQDGATYAAVFPALTAGRWQVTLEDAGRNWRLVGDLVVPGRASVELAPR
jgi:hypothetical protein